MSATLTPTVGELKQIVANAQTCLTCDAGECGTSGSPCFEFTPEGAVACSQLLWWNGHPVPREMLLEWNETLRRLEFANRGD
ncbi:MAG: hypothetical protein HY741_10425 [Chloroflexi bacterium]|nr:hypothetical protein [Chloroflexota bacterium]